MADSIDIWEFLAGLGIFLMGLFFLEEALKNLAGRAFKRFLRKHTQNRFKAILSGTFVTAVLQSSSVVTLIVLAFVGAGVMTLQNAIGVVIGSNLGTTFTGWIVAAFGFQLNIESFAMPFIAIGGLSLLFLKDSKRLVEVGRFIMGFGLLFLGLNYMKLSIENITNTFDIAPFVAYGPYALFAVGFVLTAIIQSSSAAMVITLSALHAGIIPLESAAAMVIGSDLGTTITTLLAAINGTSSKKRVALSHFLFNLITDVVALFLISPLLYLITDVLGVVDPLITLVLFHSAFNILGIIITFPFLGLFAKFLEGRFKDKDGNAAIYIDKVATEVPEAAVSALEREVRHLIRDVIFMHVKTLNLKEGLFNFDAQKMHVGSSQSLSSIEYQHVYETIKQLEGEMVPFYVKIQNEKLQSNESNMLNQLIHSTRYAMMAAKGLKDVAHNVDEFGKSANDTTIALFSLLKSRLLEFYLNLHHTFESDKHAIHFEALVDSLNENQSIYDQFIKETYRQLGKEELTEQDISTLLNVNREIYNANHALILAIKDVLLTFEQAESFRMISQNIGDQ